MVPDYRSTGSYGQQAVAKALERNELDRADILDVLGGVDRLIQLGIADSGRLGVYGLSAGALRTNWLVAVSRRFHAAVSIEGNAEWYMLSCSGSLIGCSPGTRRLVGGWPWEVPERYRHASVIEHVRGATTPTLFLMGSAYHGGIDQNLSVDFLYGALRRQGVETKFVRYPDEGHGILRAANRRDLVERAVQWIDEHLGVH